MSFRLACIGFLLLSSCMESPFSPPPQISNCGSEAEPCALTCQLDCAPSTVDAATTCMMTLEGTLDSSRKVCAFPDGNQVTFEQALPEEKGDLSGRVFSFTIARGAKSCLSLSSQPLPWQGGGTYSKTTAKSARGSYSQEIWGEARTLPTGDAQLGKRDAGRPPPVVSRIRLSCADERIYAAEGAAICSSTDDAAAQRLGPPLLELRVIHRQSFEFTLLSGTKVTPLFTCR
jgi:hypothetical protein